MSYASLCVGITLHAIPDQEVSNEEATATVSHNKLRWV